ncbi:MAG TPA: tyrosine-type recombinase/integrase, partial [Bradyrhizobium sp.]
VRQKKTGRPVRFELSKQTRQAVDDYLKAANKRPGEFLFTGRRGANRNKTTRQYARLVSEWIGSVGLDPRLFGTHSLRRTKAILIYRRTGNLRAVQLLLETTTYCSRTSARRSDLLSVPSSVRRDRADKQAIRLSRH